jgi:hypothetical protein
MIIYLEFVILSEAKDLLFVAGAKGVGCETGNRQLRTGN